MYERPKRPRAVTADDVERAAFREALTEAIEHDPDVRTAILRLLATTRTRRTRPTVTPPIRQTGRGR
ncbi:hypothetical protein [Kitasatospora sp. NPDC056731]|uniref:hypothetical protein n=1 Tax=Kitasatospora sp. NPDC056731 TaxID=3155422 RepID=UPI00343C6A84